MRSRALTGVLVAVVVLGACTSSTEETTTTGATTTTAAATTTTAAATTTTTAAATTTTTAAATTTTTAAATTTTTTAPPTVEVNDEGIRAADEWVYFGYDDEDAIAAVAAVLGSPDVDTGWIDSFSVYGTCPGPVVRGVEWGGFTMLFTQADTDFWSGGVPHFFAYYHTSTPPSLQTTEGLAIGMTLADLEAIYGGPDLITAEADLIPGFTFWSYDQAMWTGMWGYADGLEATSPISSINGGLGCGE